MRLLVIFVLLTFAGSQLLEKVEACFQDSPSVHLRARTIAGTVTLRGKPLDGAVFRLHKFLSPYSIEPAHADPHVLGEAMSAKDGTFNFGEVPSGKYVVFVGSPSLESIVVEVVKPRSGESDTIAIDNFADSCISAAVISADGRKVTQRSGSTIVGMGSYRKE